MNWPIGWTSLEPLLLNDWKEWLGKNACTLQGTTTEKLSAMRQEDDSAPLEEWQARQYVCEKDVLQFGVLRQSTGGGTSDESGISKESTAENQDDDLPEMWSDQQLTEASSRYNKAPRGDDSMPILSCCGGHETEQMGWWQQEPEIPRVAKGVTDRTNRLTALGNGQVPICAAVAFLLLAGEIQGDA